MCCLPALAFGIWIVHEMWQILMVIVGVLGLLGLTAYGVQCLTDEEVP